MECIAKLRDIIKAEGFEAHVDEEREYFTFIQVRDL